MGPLDQESHRTRLRTQYTSAVMIISAGGNEQ